MPLHLINSADYRNDRFETDWEAKGGPQQTRFFCRLGAENLPAWLLHAIRTEQWSLCDWGCALGEGTDLLHHLLRPASSVGIDISEQAVARARARYPNLDFQKRDLVREALEKPVNLVFTSNTIEHFAEPWTVLERVAASASHAVVVLMPANEFEREPEHLTTFTPANVPLHLPPDFGLVGARLFDTGKMKGGLWSGQQFLLTYLRLDEIGRRGLSLADLPACSEAEVPGLVAGTWMLPVAALRAELEKERAEGVALRAELEKERASGAALGQSAKQERAAAAALRAELEKERASGAALGQSVKQERAAAAALRAELEKERASSVELSQSIEQERTRAAHAEALGHAFQNRVEALESSTSWKLMSPLRAVAGVTRLIFNFGHHGRRARHIVRLAQEQGSSRAAAWLFARMWHGRQHQDFQALAPDPASLSSRQRLAAEEFAELLSSKQREGVPVFVQLPTIDWSVPLFQRPQQIAMAMARQGAFVIFHTNNHFDNVVEFEEIYKDVWLFTDLKYLHILKDCIMSTYSTTYTHLDYDTLKILLKSNLLIYEYVDHIDEAISGKVNIGILRKFKRFCFKHADIILASSKKLYDEACPINPRKPVACVPNGVDYHHYASAIQNPAQTSEEYEEFCSHHQIIIGYFGALAPWLWYELINDVTAQRKELGFIFIGPDYSGGMNKLERRDNVLLTGPISYQDLPNYARRFDVAIIPFRHGEIAQTTSPLKLFEYFALEKPVVVTTEMLECTVYPEVFRAADAVEFCKEIDRAIAASRGPEMKARLKQLALENTWDQRAAEILRIVQAVREPRGADVT